MVRILASMCDSDGWGYITLTGKDTPCQRDQFIKQYRDYPEIQNEAVEQQAFCRLYRIGQQKGVEFVWLTVRNTIDDRLTAIQREKINSINKTMGPDVISARQGNNTFLLIHHITR
ncbi:hypothetical protein VTO42DRAFT_2048 [Malbranchea cinnamomea]